MSAGAARRVSRSRSRIARRPHVPKESGSWISRRSPTSGRCPGSSRPRSHSRSVRAPTPIDEIAAYLAPREALVVVDNCEHLVDEVAEFVDVLLERGPRLRALATSRESLDVEGEFTWKVPSLGIGAHAPAVQLFRERAAAAGAVLDLDDTTTTLVVEIVERLDGIPLAIELAAARTRTMELAELRDRLDDRFRLLSGGSRRSRQRQATLEGAVQWSYDLLSAAEQSMLQTLAVFQGGFSVADAAAVAEVRDNEAIELIDSLAAKSLVDVTRDSRRAPPPSALGDRPALRALAAHRRRPSRRRPRPSPRALPARPGRRVVRPLPVVRGDDEDRERVRELPVGCRLGEGAGKARGDRPHRGRGR